MSSNNIVQATYVIGVGVKNPVKEDLGKIEDIMINKISGEVHYAVLSFGGILGLGEKLFAIPWKSLRYSVEDKCFILDISKDRLKNAPGFDQNNWPNMADEKWQTSIRTYYNPADLI